LPANHEAEFYSDSSVGQNPFSVNNGVLTISATPAAPGSNPYGLPYDSGVISTQDSFSQEYGYFEMRAQLPAGAGLWPAFWMIPKDGSFSSELDVFEQLGNDTKTIYQTAHDWAGGDAQTGQQIFTGPDSSTGFHTYGVDWEPDKTTFYEDGKAQGSVVTPAGMKTPMIMMANLAVGGAGSWPGAPDGSTKLPAQMNIDYIRAYATANTTNVSGRAALANGGTGPAPAAAPQGAAAVATSTDASLVPGGASAQGAATTAPAATVSTKASVASAAPSPSGTGSDTVALNLSEDAYQGDAQFTFSVDGKQVGAAQSVSASHGQGQSEAFTFKGDWSAGLHQFGVSFTNDAWDGTAATDRNLYIDSATFDGSKVQGNAALYSNSTVTFSAGSAQVSSSQSTATMPATSSTTAADANTHVVGKDPSTVTGGSGVASYILHAASGEMSITDFNPAKGDTLTVDKALQPYFTQTDDGHGGALITFGDEGGFDLLHHAPINQSDIRFI